MNFKRLIYRLLRSITFCCVVNKVTVSNAVHEGTGMHTHLTLILFLQLRYLVLVASQKRMTFIVQHVAVLT